MKTIAQIRCKIIPYDDKQFIKENMGRLKLASYLINRKNADSRRCGENTCVVDYVWDQTKSKKGFKTYDYHKLKN